MEYGKKPFWQKILASLVIGGVAYGLVYYFYSATPQTTQLSEDIIENVIIYSDTGFSPKSLTIKPNTTVTFKNGSEKSMWVASNPHPIHSDYSALDAKKEYKNGESYQFTFTEVKEYTYHDHLNPSNEGVIIVE